MRRVLLLSLAVVQTAAAQGNMGGRPPLPHAATKSADTAAMYLRASDAERAFLNNWKNAWRASEALRAKAEHDRLALLPPATVSVQHANPRGPELSCNAGERIPEREDWGLPPKARRIASKNGSLGVCPNWMPPGTPAFPALEIPDERLGIDGALAPEIRAVIAESRARLIALMDTVVSAMPRNGTVLGQLVRLLVDQGDLDGADRVVRDCKAPDWWCHALGGYVFARRGNILVADSLFRVSAQWLIETDRCKWTDISTLLDAPGRAAYVAMPCAGRLKFNDQFWWLSDPLWSVPGNDRRVEQFSRQIITTLHAASVTDERYNWTAPYGGDALTEVVQRYGWPAYTRFGQLRAPPGPTLATGTPDLATRMPAQVKMHDQSTGIGRGENPSVEGFYDQVRRDFLGLCINTVPGTAPICTGFDIGPLSTPIKPPVVPPIGTVGSVNAGSTFEYSLGRAHAVPVWSALQNPFSARVSDWAVSGPRDTSDALSWWPQEHYAPAHPIEQFTDFQSAILRREQSSLLAFSTNLRLTYLGRHVTELRADSVTALLLYSGDPRAIMSVASQRRSAADRLVFFENLPNNPIVASVEIPWDSTDRPAGRARFGVTPPAPLREQHPGDVAISEPVLLLAADAGSALPNDADAAIPLMLGGTTLRAGVTAVGVYWETYGFAATDTLEVTLHVQRQTPLSLLERTAVAAGLGSDLNTPVSASWREPDAGHNTRTVPGAVPIQMRSIVLGISPLGPGEYLLRISVGKPAQPPVESRRAFSIR